MDDVRESVAELAYYKANFLSSAAGAGAGGGRSSTSTSATSSADGEGTGPHGDAG
jgi:hypothetical protein